MIIARNGIWLTFVSETSPSITTYNKYYLDVVINGDVCQFKYHNNAITKVEGISFFKDSFLNVFTTDTITELQNFLDEDVTIESQGSLYMAGNTTPTIMSGSSNPSKALGTTIGSLTTEDFVNTDNRSEYTGFETKYFIANSAASITATKSRDIVGYITRNGVIIDESQGVVTADGSNNEVTLISKCKLLLAYGDYVEFWVGNQTNNNNIVVRNLNTTID